MVNLNYLAHRVAPYATNIGWGLLLAILLLFAGCATVPAPNEPIMLSAEQFKILREACHGGASVDVGKIEISSTTYPCEILRTYAAIEATRGRGFWMGTFPRWMLQMRLVTKGIFSGIAGLVGLG